MKYQNIYQLFRAQTAEHRGEAFFMRGKMTFGNCKLGMILKRRFTILRVHYRQKV